MDKITCSTGHRELDDILKNNGIIDQDEQQRLKRIEEIAEFILKAKELKDFKEKFEQLNPINFRPSECLIQKAVQREIDEGVPAHRRTKFWYISCPCRKCRPFYL